MITEKTIQQRTELKKHLDSIVGHFESMKEVMKNAPKIRGALTTRFRALDNGGKSYVTLKEREGFIMVNYQINGQEYTMEIGRKKLK